MSIKPITLTIFFPTFNEEENIKEAVQETVRIADDSPYISDYEIVIVNDGSTDNTLAIAEDLATQYSQVRVVDHGQNRGYGEALKSGFTAATKDYVFFTDADLQFDISEIHHLLIHVSEYDAVIGYRSPRQDPFMRLLNAKVWNILNRTLFGLRIKDIDCAFKLFKRELVQNIALKSHGAMISAETLIRLSRQGVVIKQVPVSHLPRKAGSATGAKPSVILRALREMLGLYWFELGTESNKEILKFMTVGVLNTIIDITLYFVITRYTTLFAEHLLAAKFISFIFGTISSLLLNRSWTFNVRSRLTLSEVGRFYTATSISILIDICVMNALLKFGMYDLLALALTTIVTFAFNFTLAKMWVFKARYKRYTEVASQS